MFGARPLSVALTGVFALTVIGLLYLYAPPGHAAVGRCWTASGTVRDEAMRTVLQVERDAIVIVDGDVVDAHVDELFAARQSTVAVSLRMPPDLLGRVKREAGRAGVPYQRFIKGILEAGVTRLERKGPAPKRSRSSSKAREARR